MAMKWFRVVLDDAVDTAAVGEGFVDDRTPTEFSGSLPSTLLLSLDKERANMRWQEIVRMLLETGSRDVTSVDKTGGDEDSPPTVISFTVGQDETQVVWMHDLVTDPTGATVYGPASVGGSVTELLVIERAIATALSQVAFTDSRQVYNPTANVNPDQWITVTCDFV